MPKSAEQVELIEAIRQWLATEDGERSINAAVKDADSAAEKLGQAREISEDLLNRPVTL